MLLFHRMVSSFTASSDFKLLDLLTAQSEPRIPDFKAFRPRNPLLKR